MPGRRETQRATQLHPPSCCPILSRMFNRLVGTNVALVALLLSAASPAPLMAEDAPRLSIHGHLTQGWARAFDTPYLGITEDGTFDYRKAALQFRYDMGDRHTFMLQLAHERFGESPVQEFHDDLEVDWAYYQYDFSKGFWGRAGRVVVPLGVFNEIRDVGTLLPFYRLSYVVYGEGTYSTEALDGVSAGRRWQSGNWGFDLAGYFGELKQFQGESVALLRNFGGGQGWVETPVSGLRFGVGYWHANVKGSVTGAGPDGRENWDQLLVSAEAKFERLRLVGEWTRFGYTSGDYPGFYLLASVKATEKLSLHALYENADYTYIDLNDPALPVTEYADYDRDLRLGVSWAFRPDVVLRVEHHFYRGFTVEAPEGVDFERPDGYVGNHTIVSLSASF